MLRGEAKPPLVYENISKPSQEYLTDEPMWVAFLSSVKSIGPLN